MVAMDTKTLIKSAVKAAKIELFKDVEAVATATSLNNDHGDNREAILIERQDLDALKRRHLDPSPVSEEGSEADLRIE